jgi:predicted ATP-dependent endonuclease of OLD family
LGLAPAGVTLKGKVITRIRLENFMRFRDAECSLQPLTVLVGPNGAGKTSVLTAIRHMVAAQWDSLLTGSVAERSQLVQSRLLIIVRKGRLTVSMEW